MEVIQENIKACGVDEDMVKNRKEHKGKIRIVYLIALDKDINKEEEKGEHSSYLYATTTKNRTKFLLQQKLIKTKPRKTISIGPVLFFTVIISKIIFNLTKFTFESSVIIL